MRVKCNVCGEEQVVDFIKVVFSPLRIPLIGYSLECSVCSKNTFHRVIREEDETRFGLSDLSRFKDKEDKS